MQKIFAPKFKFHQKFAFIAKGKIVSKSLHAHTNIDKFKGKFKKNSSITINFQANLKKQIAEFKR